MTASLATYISLPGTTAEAMRFWHQIFGGELQIFTYGDMKLEGLPFQPDPDAVAHAALTLPEGIIAGGDSMAEPDKYPVEETAYSLLYTVDTPEDARALFGELLDSGGEQLMPLEIAPWGDLYGQVRDKFGVTWAFVCEGSNLQRVLGAQND